MTRTLLSASAWALLLVCSIFQNGRSLIAEEKVRFSRDVLPILSDRCFLCHGPDESSRGGDLRLDLREDAISDRGGYSIIVPGDATASEIFERITTDDDDILMPPPSSHRKKLTDQEVETLRRWVNEGAEWGRHWSFEKPVPAEIPELAPHPIDALVLHQLQQSQLSLSPAASRATLIRRVSFDLTGLPPTSQEVHEFLNDDTPDAYNKLVERLLNSQHYGERMAMWWLDAARYSDTDGFQLDDTRTNWAWRDWVIEAFNKNMKFDQFTIEQFAGDLLPDATPEQILATCFHRNHMTNGEGGRDPEESRIDYVMDRVNTTGTVWLGLTLGCAQCHTHKFDPITQHDYYQLFAFFNDIDEDGNAGRGAKPYLQYQSPYVQRAIDESQAVADHRLAKLNDIRSKAQPEFEEWLAHQQVSVNNGFSTWKPLIPTALTAIEGTVLTHEEEGIIQASGPNPIQDDYRLQAFTTLPRITGVQLEILPHETHTEGKLSRGASGEFILTDVKLQIRRAGTAELVDVDFSSAIANAELGADKNGNYGRIRDILDDDPRNGWTTQSHDATQPYRAVLAIKNPLQIEPDDELVFVMYQRSTQGDTNIGRFRVSLTDQSGPAVHSLEKMPLEELAELKPSSTDEIPEALKTRLLDQFLFDHAAWSKANEEFKRAQQQLTNVRNAAQPLGVMVLKERSEPRTAYLLERGVWDQKGDIVQRGVPQDIFPKQLSENPSRLELAQWLVSTENPLTARVIVNQLWQMCFGQGLVRTPEDFGLQGELPVYPEVLDWLAIEFMESGWDIKHVLNLIVTSQTYQQQSTITPELQELDPENKLLARGPRFRLPSWMIRDALLQSSGLLNSAIGGPPVMPNQPEGVWEELFMGRFTYQPSQGPAQYRRTLYAFWRRSIAPTFLFDNAQRRSCEVTNRLTNTPLHALTLLNDLTQLEASRELARQAITEHESIEQRVQRIFERILSRSPAADELAALITMHQQAEEYYRENPQDAELFLMFGQPEHQQIERPAELAAGLIVSSLIFNLDEALTHE